jgi:hypothetical protein
MARNLVASFVSILVCAALPVGAQTGDASLRGFVKDQQGGVLPGVTVTATGPTLLSPVVAVTDATGYYRLNNLPPGTFTVTAELAGFSTYKREGILTRAGSTFSIDVEMQVGTLSETVTVSGESPMIETQKPTSVLTIQGELLRASPVTSRRLFSDVLDMAPGISSRNVNDGVGRRAYYFHGTVLFGHVIMIEGAPASSYLDASAHSMGMGGDTIADSELKLGGVDAASPMSTGVIMNIMAPRGGNVFKGSFTDDTQLESWNSDNTIGGNNPGGIPTVQSVKQVDGSLGGPIVKGKTWFFGSFRYANLTNGISRTPANVTNLDAFAPGFTPFSNVVHSKQPFLKVTSQVGAKHEFSAFYQSDRLIYTSDRELDANIFQYNSTGGGMEQAKLASVWTNKLTTVFSASYNNKSGNDANTYAGVTLSGPQIQYNQNIFTSGGVPTGTGILVMANTPTSISISPTSMVTLRGDVTYFTEGFGGSHELKTGIFAAPRSNRDTNTQYVNNGYAVQAMRQNDPNNPAAGSTVFQQTYYSPTTAPQYSERDRDIGLYVQDSWKPGERLTVDLGIRYDYVHRLNALRNYVTEAAAEIQPRLGVAYLVTPDAHNVLRASYSRLADQMNGRDYIVTFGATTNVTVTNVYTDATGKQTTVITPPTTTVPASLLYAPNLHQPWVNEFVVGFRKQFPGQLSVDIAGTRRIFHDQFDQVDINGIYPSGPNQPFGGFGLVDPNRGLVYQERNNNWSQTVITDVEGTIAKNMSHNFQAVMSFTRQWDSLRGSFNPTDPANFIQPGAFPNDREINAQEFGNGDNNSYNGGGTESGAAYRPYAVRIAGQYLAPWELNVGVSYIIQAGGYSGPVMITLAAPDPVYGPPTVKLANGLTQPNPLATPIRFQGPTRSDGQTANDTDRYLQLHVGRIFKFGRHQFEPAINVFNLFNTGAYTQWNTGANLLYSPNYLSVFNRQPPRAFQITGTYRF